MPSLKTLLLSTTLLSTLAAAKLDRDTITCPEGWFPNTFKETKCCYGHMMVEDTDASCCVNYIPPYDPDATIITTTTTSAVSSTTTSMDPQAEWSGADYCFSKVPFTASDYSARVSVASSNVVKASASVTATGPSGTEATVTATATDSGVSSGTGAAAETSAPNAAVSVAGGKEMVVVGGAAVVVWLFML